MYDLDLLTATYENPSNERNSGKTVMNCFNVAAYIDLIKTKTLVVAVENLDTAYYFSLELKKVLVFLGIEFKIPKQDGNGVSFIITDQDAECDKIQIISFKNENYLHGRDCVVYHVYRSDIFGCNLDYDYSKIPPDDRDYWLIKA